MHQSVCEGVCRPQGPTGPPVRLQLRQEPLPTDYAQCLQGDQEEVHSRRKVRRWPALSRPVLRPGGRVLLDREDLRTSRTNHRLRQDGPVLPRRAPMSGDSSSVQDRRQVLPQRASVPRRHVHRSWRELRAPGADAGTPSHKSAGVTSPHRNASDVHRETIGASNLDSAVREAVAHAEHTSHI
jgi:hypothetical protein